MLSSNLKMGVLQSLQTGKKVSHGTEKYVRHRLLLALNENIDRPERHFIC